MRRAPVHRRHAPPPPPSGTEAAAAPAAEDLVNRRPWWRPGSWPWRTLLLCLAVLLLGVLIGQRARPPAAAPPRLTAEQLEPALAAVWDKQNLPSRTRQAAAAIAPAVVRINGMGPPSADPAAKGRKAASAAGGKAIPVPQDHPDIEVSVGTGVVIKEDGTILTNLHVVQNAPRLKVTFFDGSQAPAMVVAVHPHKDLAVIRASKLPDDLEPAVLAGAADLVPGDEVVAVGYPFGIGPSVSAGVVSGLGRSFRVRRDLTMDDLIQFDAAANPGNSGGPLVNLRGEVVGIVTAIYNPNETASFIGIGFATTMESLASAVGLPPF